MKQLSVVSCQLSVIGRRKFFFAVLFLLITAYCSPLAALAQGDTQQAAAATAAPPPLKFVSKDEKKQLTEQSDTKKRTKLSLVLMEVRLKKAEELNAQQQFREMFDELGGFQALVADALDFLNRRDDGRGEVLNNFKRFEMSIRAFLPRVELIRRELPPEFEPYVRSLAKYLRDTRSKAVEPLFGDNIVKDN